MEYRAHGSPVDQRGFTPENQSELTHPPFPDTYTDPNPTVDASKTNSDHADSNYNASPLERDTRSEPSHYSYYSHQVAASSTATPFQVPFPNHGPGLPTFGQSNPNRSPASSWELETTTCLPENHGPSNTYEASSGSASGSPEAALKKAPRGTTGRFACDQCGIRFLTVRSLIRHKSITCGKKMPRNQPSMQTKVTKTKSPDPLLMSDKDFNALLAYVARPTTPREQDQDLPHIENLHVKSTTSTIANSSAAANAALIATPSTPSSTPHSTASTQGYVPTGPDTSGDHTIFFCDRCAEFCGRRNLLQTHKAQVHGLVEFPYMPEPGVIDVPPYLQRETSKIGTKHSLPALHIYQNGGLSSSPCQPCKLRGFDCIVSPNLSSKCAYCRHSHKPQYCGAAGVKCDIPRPSRASW